MSEENLNLRVVVDSAGRTIVGEFSSETAKKFELKNPATLFIQPNQQTGQLAVQLIPFFFREFITEDQRASGLVWTFDKANIVISSDFDLDDRLLQQYTNMMTKEANTNPPPVEEVEKEGEVKEVKLFDEEKAE